jgi:hypothetical protein
MNRQAVDMWTMRFAHRCRPVDSANITRCPPCATFAHMTTAFHHV